MPNQAVEKNVYFYKTFAEPSFGKIDAQCDPQKSDTEKLYNMFKVAFPNGVGPYTCLEESNKHHFDIYEFNKSHIFGTHSKEEENPNSLAQIRDLKTNTTKPLLSEATSEEVLEYYTFFYVDFERLMIAVIYNKQAGALDKALQKYFFQQNCLLEIVPYSIDNIQNALKHFKKINNIEYTYNKKTAQKQFKTLSELNSLDLEVGSYKITLSITRHSNQLASEISKLNTDKYSSLKISGKSADDIKECFDVVKKIFLRTTKINILINPKGNFEIIKNTLASEIVKILND